MVKKKKSQQKESIHSTEKKKSLSSLGERLSLVSLGRKSFAKPAILKATKSYQKQEPTKTRSEASIRIPLTVTTFFPSPIDDDTEKQQSSISDLLNFGESSSDYSLNHACSYSQLSLLSRKESDSDDMVVNMMAFCPSLQLCRISHLSDDGISAKKSKRASGLLYRNSKKRKAINKMKPKTSKYKRTLAVMSASEYLSRRASLPQSLYKSRKVFFGSLIVGIISAAAYYFIDESLWS